jgi:hypothetical protein
MQQEFIGLDWRALVDAMADGAVILDAKNRIPKEIGNVPGVKLIRI